MDQGHLGQGTPLACLPSTAALLLIVSLVDLAFWHIHHNSGTILGHHLSI